MSISIWNLYWLPFILIVHYLAKFIIIFISIFTTLAFLKIHNIQKFIFTIKLWCFSVFSEIAGVSVFYIIEKFIPDIIYNCYIIFSIIAFLIAVTISFSLNFFLGLNKTDISKKERFIICIWILVFTAPYLFLMQN